MRSNIWSSSTESVDDVLRKFEETSKNEGIDLQDSCLTSPTETGSISEDESLGWLGGITADIRTLAFNLKEKAGGVASFVKHSALAVASEIAHLEEAEMANHGNYHHYDIESDLRFPWEILNFNGQFVEDEDLKEKISALSTKEEAFLSPFSASDQSLSSRPDFLLDEPRIRLVRRILNMDEKLAATHARMSGRSDVKEAVFWKNYFHNCELAREEHFVLCPVTFEGQDSDDEVEDDEKTQAGEEGSFIEIPSPPVSQRSVDSFVDVNANDLDIPNY
mmetsp:Transcript_20740/g.26774  ORF Transcript_20740/g.26774 Transcript_20740/m.26774 type:complete len:277 (+) Transcript_20740:174-1004(+)|eukprot:CAMPEP_0198144808 /NCGR_PEP_ID=MMETSP1443-20131203/18682_1 /TAXON_ID=186043 /ORGANISM="Entomoneis sp., Strain CCMP2396" /LENGTH=276 /DNA_ID=CAMNT_0043808271 /DNA_START=157 /DNA_END=987 /DNA_ORIENTATION=-